MGNYDGLARRFCCAARDADGHRRRRLIEALAQPAVGDPARFAQLGQPKSDATRMPVQSQPPASHAARGKSLRGNCLNDSRGCGEKRGQAGRRDPGSLRGHSAYEDGSAVVAVAE